MANTLIERFKQWSSCDVADGMSKLGHVHGGYLDGLTLYSPEYQSGPTKIVGRAMTVKFVAKSDMEAPSLQGNYIDQIPEGAIVFISQPTPHVNAVYGGLMSLRAQTLGAAGVIIDGKLRDLQEHRNLQFPVFAKGTGTTAGGAVCRPSELNISVRLSSQSQDAWIHPGDILVGDSDGVVCVPAELAAKVLDAIPKIVEADEKCAEGIRQGRSVAEVFKDFRGR